MRDEMMRLRSLTSEKWTRYPVDVVPAWVADMDLPPAPIVTDAVRALLERGDLGYNFDAESELPELFAERCERLYAWRPDTERVRLFCDVMQAVELALWSHTEPGDGVAVFTPVYQPFYAAVERTRCRLVDVPLEAPASALDADYLGAAIDPGTRAILLCNPHNPTGRAFTRDELLGVLDVVERHDLLVISDEIWSDLVWEPARHIPFASLSAEAEARTVTITAASKAFNLAGLRCAVAHLGHDDVASTAAALPSHLLGAVSSLGAEATRAAWTAGDSWLRETRAMLRANRNRVIARLHTELPGVACATPEATYLAWIDLRGAGLGANPAKRLLEDARVALSRGTVFGRAGAGFVRLNFATHPELLDEILHRIIGAAGGAA
jgi:cystathionine beta-lyase